MLLQSNKNRHHLPFLSNVVSAYPWLDSLAKRERQTQCTYYIYGTMKKDLMPVDQIRLQGGTELFERKLVVQYLLKAVHSHCGTEASFFQKFDKFCKCD